MPLQGNIRDFTTTQLLNLMNLSNRTGMLTIFEAIPTGEKDAMDQEKMKAGGEKAKMAFHKGKLIYATMKDQDSGLVSVLNRAGKLTDKQANALKTRVKNTSDKALAMRLIGAKYVSQKDIVTCIRQHVLDVVYNLMTWQDGPFRFDENIKPDNNHILVPIDLEQVIIEGTKVLKEKEEINKHIENLDVSLKFPQNPREKFKGIHLSVQQWKVVSYVSPKNTIRQIAKANNMSEMEIKQIVFGLEQAGLVEIVRPRGTGQKARPGKRTRGGKTAPAANKQVVNKLIDKLKSL